jgi:hypothetical protein
MQLERYQLRAAIQVTKQISAEFVGHMAEIAKIPIEKPTRHFRFARDVSDVEIPVTPLVQGCKGSTLDSVARQLSLAAEIHDFAWRVRFRGTVAHRIMNCGQSELRWRSYSGVRGA